MTEPVLPADEVAEPKVLDPNELALALAQVRQSSSGIYARDVYDSHERLRATVARLRTAADDLSDVVQQVLIENEHGSLDTYMDEFANHVRAVHDTARAALDATSGAPEPTHDESCWLCQGLGGVAVHNKASEAFGKRLLVAHAPESKSHPVHPCPVAPEPTRQPLWEGETQRYRPLVRRPDDGARSALYVGKLDVPPGTVVQVFAADEPR